MRNMFMAMLASLLFSMQPGFADPLQPVALEPIKHSPAKLVVVSPDGTEKTYTPAELEAFPTYSLVTTTPWRDEPANFEGVLLADILRANGLTEAASVIVTAENDYATSVERALWEGIDILVATRVDGRPHSRRARGPIQFVIDSDVMATSELAHEGTLVWMAARIEAED